MSLDLGFSSTYSLLFAQTDKRNNVVATEILHKWSACSLLLAPLLQVYQPKKSSPREENIQNTAWPVLLQQHQKASRLRSTKEPRRLQILPSKHTPAPDPQAISPWDNHSHSKLVNSDLDSYGFLWVWLLLGVVELVSMILIKNQYLPNHYRLYIVKRFINHIDPITNLDFNLPTIYCSMLQQKQQI